MFYRIEIVKTATETSKAIYSYDNSIDALGAYHSGLGGWMKKHSEIVSVLEMVISEEGKVIASSYNDF